MTSYSILQNYCHLDFDTLQNAGFSQSFEGLEKFWNCLFQVLRKYGKMSRACLGPEKVWNILELKE